MPYLFPALCVVGLLAMAPLAAADPLETEIEALLTAAQADLTALDGIVAEARRELPPTTVPARRLALTLVGLIDWQDRWGPRRSDLSLTVLEQGGRCQVPPAVCTEWGNRQHRVDASSLAITGEAITGELVPTPTLPECEPALDLAYGGCRGTGIKKGLYRTGLLVAGASATAMKATAMQELAMGHGLTSHRYGFQ